MAEIFTSRLFYVMLTLGIFVLSQMLYQRYKWALLNPVLLSIAGVICFLKVLNIPYSVYLQGGQLISFLLGPAVVALGVPLYLQLETVRKNSFSILTALLAGSLIGVLSGCGIAMLLHSSKTVILSIAPRSVTMPIALGISEKIGGVPSLTAAFVVVTGILGAVIGPAVLKFARIRKRSAFGLALGAASHGIGTARALEEGQLEGAFAGLAIGLMGVITALLIPFLIKWLL